MTTNQRLLIILALMGFSMVDLSAQKPTITPISEMTMSNSRKQPAHIRRLIHQVVIHGDLVKIDSWMAVNPSISVKITSLKWYLSVQGKKPQTCLLDLSKSESLLHTVKYPEGSRLYFGIDSQTQVQATRSGALDPIHGMYWTWQSGYIQWKMEGVMKTDTQEFPIELHLGGFQNNLETGQVLLPLDWWGGPSFNCIQVQWILDELLLSITPNTARVMSPCPLAQEYAQRIANGVYYDLINIEPNKKR